MNRVKVIVFINCFVSLFSFPNAIFDKIKYYNSLIPNDIELRKRILTTVCCNDCDILPKVENAGKVIVENEKAPYQIMHNGIKILQDCYYGNWMTILIELLQGHHEPQEEKPFHEILKYIPGNAVMVELGSYWGYYSMWFQQRVPGAKNFLIEPDPKNIIIGQNNFQLNGMQGFFTQAMIGEKNSEHQIFIDWDYNKHDVQEVCMDDFATENNIDFIHILHSDIQGAEVNMLRGCQKLMAQKRIGYYFISTHRGTHEECFKILQEANLEIMVSITREESFSADGLIIAKLPEIKGPSELNISRRSPEFRDLVERIDA